MSSEKTFSPMRDLLGSPEAAAATAMYRSRAIFNRNIYTPSMLMTKEEVSDARKLELSISTEFSAAEHSSGLNASDDPSEVSFVPFPSSRAAYNQTVFSPSMGVTAEELAAMRSAKSRHLVMVSSSCDGDGSVEVLETRPAAAPVQSFRALYNRVIHSPSMGVSQQELEALQLAAQMARSDDEALPAPSQAAALFGVVPVQRFRSLYRKVKFAAAATSPGNPGVSDDELSALRVAACFAEDDGTPAGAKAGEGWESGGADSDDSQVEWQVGVMPMSTFAGGTPFARADDSKPCPDSMVSAESMATGSCTAEMLMRWAVSGQELFSEAAGHSEAARVRILSSSGQPPDTSSGQDVEWPGAESIESSGQESTPSGAELFSSSKCPTATPAAATHTSGLGVVVGTRCVAA